MNQAIFVADCRYIEALREAFGRFGTFVPSAPCKTLAEPESCHPDMVLYADAENTVICAPPVYEAYQRRFDFWGYFGTRENHTGTGLSRKRCI